jgi:ATP-dependent DNA ligase
MRGCFNELPEGSEWLYEVKFDGYRCLAVKSVNESQ